MMKIMIMMTLIINLCLPLNLLLWVGVNTGCWDPVLAPTNTSRHTGRCQHWVPTPSVDTYQYN